MQWLRQLLGLEKVEQKTRSMPARPPRVQLGPLHNAVFQCENIPGLSRMPVGNLSTSGIGLLREGASEWPEKGGLLEGSLRVMGRDYQVAVEVVHVNERVVGCFFKTVPDHFVRDLIGDLASEFAALKLRKVRPELLKREEGEAGTPYLFWGSNDCELYYVEDQGELLYFNLTFFGNFIEGDRDGKVRAGTVDEEYDEEVLRYRGAALVERLRAISPEQGQAAARFVAGVAALDSRIRDRICALLLSPR